MNEYHISYYFKDDPNRRINTFAIWANSLIEASNAFESNNNHEYVSIVLKYNHDEGTIH